MQPSSPHCFELLESSADLSGALPQYLCNGLEEDIEARKAAAGHSATELDQLVQVSRLVLATAVCLVGLLIDALLVGHTATELDQLVQVCASCYFAKPCTAAASGCHAERVLNAMWCELHVVPNAGFANIGARLLLEV